jgi:hypothetical protein
VQQLLPQTRPHEAAVELSPREALRKRNVPKLLHQQLQPKAERGGKGGQTEWSFPRLRTPQHNQRGRNFVIFWYPNYFYVSSLCNLAKSQEYYFFRPSKSIYWNLNKIYIHIPISKIFHPYSFSP